MATNIGKTAGENVRRLPRVAERAAMITSWGTQGQLVRAGKSLNGRDKNSSFLTFLRPNFFLARLDFSPPPVTAPGSPRVPAPT